MPKPDPYYKVSCGALRDEIAKKFPGSRADEGARGKDMPPYLLWMADQIEKMDRFSEKDATKAGRWIGWMFAHAEMLGLWDNVTSRDLSRADVHLGFTLAIAKL